MLLYPAVITVNFLYIFFFWSQHIVNNLPLQEAHHGHGAVL